MEPAAVLVGTLEIEVGRVAGLGPVRAAHHAPVGGAGIEPDVERIAHLLVAVSIVAEQLARLEREPGLDAALLDALRHLRDQFGAARMDITRLLVEEEGNRHAPVALPRDAPVGAIGDHRVEPRLAPARIELRRLDSLERQLPERRSGNWGFGQRHIAPPPIILLRERQLTGRSRPW